MTTPKDDETPEGRLAIFPGSFDPLTNGHVDIILRSTHLFERIVVAVLVNAEKQPLFTPDERIAIIKDVFKEYPNIEVETFDGLLVEYARRRRASAIVRGIRAVSDFEYEFQMALMNRHLEPTLETVFMMPAEQYHLPEFEAHQGGVQSGRRRPRAGAVGRRAVDEPQESPAGVRRGPPMTRTARQCLANRLNGGSRIVEADEGAGETHGYVCTADVAGVGVGDAQGGG